MKHLAEKIEYLTYICIVLYLLISSSQWILQQSNNYMTITSNLYLTKSYFGGYIDLSDFQYKFFHNNIILLIILAFIHINLYKCIKKHIDKYTYNLYFIICLLLYLVGSSIIFMLCIVYINYLIKQYIKIKYIPLVTWCYNIFILLCNEYYHGYKWSLISTNLSFLDQYHGIFSWHSLFNIIILKMISFNIDYYWYKVNKPITLIDHCDNLNDDEIDYKNRVQIHSQNFNSFSKYFVYLFYPALYFAGPIITFNAFDSYITNQKVKVSQSNTLHVNNDLDLLLKDKKKM